MNLKIWIQELGREITMIEEKILISNIQITLYSKQSLDVGVKDIKPNLTWDDHYYYKLLIFGQQFQVIYYKLKRCAVQKDTYQ